MLESWGERGKRDNVSLQELKYCRDGMDDTTHERSADQHSALREAEYDVHLHTIALGTAGTVYVGLPGALTVLGVPPPPPTF